MLTGGVVFVSSVLAHGAQEGEPDPIPLLDEEDLCFFRASSGSR